MKKYMGLAAVVAIWLGLTAFAWFSPAKASSDAERRPLEQFPAVSAGSILDGSFSRDFADYAVDQFPLRDTFRSLKAVLTYYVFGQADNNGIYLYQGSAAKLDYPLNQASVTNALTRFTELYDRYLKDAASVRFAIVPDKGYYLAAPSGHPAMDYEALFRQMEEGLPWAEFIDLTDCLDGDSYYPTDTHWRQEKLEAVLERISGALGIPADTQFSQITLSHPFYGVYHGQSALPLPADRIHCLAWRGYEECKVWSLDTGKETEIYDMGKIYSRDLYDVFLSGGMALQTVENPNGTGELIVFRDSFGSSLIPLLVPQYAKITVIDTRYISPGVLENYVNFQGKDVLMLYSTLLLNSSGTLRK